MLGALSVPRTIPRAPAQRDLAANALVLGLAGTMWFGWAQQGPPAAWQTALSVGSVVGVLVAVVAVVTVGRLRRGPSAIHVPGAERTYRRVVGVEVAAILLGVLVLGLGGLSAYLSAWILFVVGVHFLPLGRLFGIADLGVVAVLLVMVSVAAMATGVSGAVLPSAVAGGGGGGVMVLAGAVSLWRCRQARPAAATAGTPAQGRVTPTTGAAATREA